MNKTTKTVQVDTEDVNDKWLNEQLETLANRWRGWAYDQLDGTSFIGDELKQIEEVKLEAKQQILDHYKDYKSPEEVEKMIIEARNIQFTKEEIAYLIEVLEWQKMSYTTAPQDLRLAINEMINEILFKLNGGK